MNNKKIEFGTGGFRGVIGDDFNKENGTHIVSAAAIHVEPIGIYGGNQDSLDAIKK